MDRKALKNSLINELSSVNSKKAFQIFSGFTRGESNFLVYLFMHRNETLYSADVGKEIGVSKQRASIITKALIDKNYVTYVKGREGSDKRKNFIKLTEDGEKAIKAKAVETSKAVDGIIEVLGEEDAENLARILAKIK